jgi:RNA polymerase sigma-70 factor (ECF subfamily)
MDVQEVRTEDGRSLASRAHQGDRIAERELCARLAPAVRAFARRRLRTRAAIEDFTQDALVHFVEALRAGRIEDPSRAGAFALGICRNLARERARARDRRREAALRWLAEPEPVAPKEPVLFERTRLEDCISTLTQRARGVLRHSFAEDSTDSEIAVALEMSEPNVRVVRHRTLAALRACLEGILSWEGAR